MSRFKILIVKPSSLGDVIHSLPFLKAIKDLYPDSYVHWVIAGGLEKLLQNHPLIQKLWIINKDKWKGPVGILRAARDLKSLSRSLSAEKFDLVVDLQGLFRSGFIAWSSKSSRIVGFSEAREGSSIFYTDRVRGGKEIHAVDRYLRIAEWLGWTGGNREFPMCESPDIDSIRKKFSLSDKYAVIIPGARWETKKWPAERFGAVASRFPFRSFVIGGRSEIALAEIVIANSNGRASSLAGRTTLNELITLLKNSRFILTNDTGPMHIAAALDIPVFAIFGPTSPVRTGPYGTKHTVMSSALACAPCFRKRCGDLRCMLSVSSEEVYAAIAKRIAF